MVVERLQMQAEELHAGRGDQLLRWQLHQDPPHAARVASDGASVTTRFFDAMDL